MVEECSDEFGLPGLRFVRIGMHGPIGDIVEDEDDVLSGGCWLGEGISTAKMTGQLVEETHLGNWPTFGQTHLDVVKACHVAGFSFEGRLPDLLHSVVQGL